MATNNALNNNLANCTGLVASTGVNASGTPSAATFLRGDDTWSTPNGSNTLKSIQITLTMVQVLASGATPIQVVAAVAGKVISMVSATIFYTYNAVTSVNSTGSTFVYTGGQVGGTINFGNLNTLTANQLFGGVTTPNAITYAGTTPVGSALYFKYSSTTATGGGTGTCLFTIFYYEV